MRRVNVAVSVFMIIGLIFFAVGASGAASTIETFVSTGNFDSLTLVPTSSTTFNIYSGQTVTCSVSADSWPYGSAGEQVFWYLNGQQVATGVTSYTTPSSLTVGSHSVVAFDNFYGYYVDFTVNVNPMPTTTPTPTPMITFYVSVSGSGTTVPAVGSYQQYYGGYMSFEAYPYPGYTFNRWQTNTGDTIYSPSFTATILSSKTYTAYFVPNPTPTPTPVPTAQPTIAPTQAPTAVPTAQPTSAPTTQQVTLTMSVAGYGTTSPSVGTHQYNINSVVTINCYPAENYHFQYWQLSDNTRKYTQSANIYLTQNLEAKALFYYQAPQPDSTPVPTAQPTIAPTAQPTIAPTAQPTQTPTVTLTTGLSGQGTINPSAGTYTYPQGQSVTISATAASGYTFSYWLMNDNSKIYSATTTLTLTVSRSALAVFTQNVAPSASPTPTVTLTMGVSGQGSISPSTGTYSYYVGSSVTITASPTSGYEFSYWLMNDNSKIYTATTTLSMTQSRSALAVFSALASPTPTVSGSSPAPSAQPTSAPTALPTASSAPSASPSPEVTPIPVDDGVIEYSYINANEAAMTIGLTMIALSGMGGVLANPGLFGRRKW